jgi:hypothetical protein
MAEINDERHRVVILSKVMTGSGHNAKGKREKKNNCTVIIRL